MVCCGEQVHQPKKKKKKMAKEQQQELEKGNSLDRAVRSAVRNHVRVQYAFTPRAVDLIKALGYVLAG